MKKLGSVFIVLLTVLCASIALADYRIDVSWTPSTDSAATMQQVLMDGVVQVDNIPMADTTASFVIPQATGITGQSVLVRTLGNIGGPGDFVDSTTQVLIQLQSGATLGGVTITYQP